jgi:hypothetical protein
MGIAEGWGSRERDGVRVLGPMAFFRYERRSDGNERQIWAE